MPADESPEPPGWYGKLPTLGDFASRRLPSGFIEPWDDWLAAGIAAWRAAAPEGWLAEYLAGPSWRFVLMPDTLPAAAGRHAWTGVLMPSVDRVGRYFPFTLAQPLPLLPAEATETERLLRWLQRLDDLAIDALHEDWTIAHLEAALQRHGSFPPVATCGDGFAGLAAGIDLRSHGSGRSLWLGTGGDGRTTLHVEQGLPTGTAFRALLAGTHAA